MHPGRRLPRPPPGCTHELCVRPRQAVGPRATQWHAPGRACWSCGPGMCGAGGSGGPGGRAPECQRLLTTRRDRQYKQELKSWPRAGLEVPRASSEPRARWQAPQDILRTKHADSSLPRWARARQWEGVLECVGLPPPRGRRSGLGRSCPPPGGVRRHFVGTLCLLPTLPLPFVRDYSKESPLPLRLSPRIKSLSQFVRLCRGAERKEGKSFDSIMWKLAGKRLLPVRAISLHLFREKIACASSSGRGWRPPRLRGGAVRAAAPRPPPLRPGSREVWGGCHAAAHGSARAGGRGWQALDTPWLLGGQEPASLQRGPSQAPEAGAVQRMGGRSSRCVRAGHQGIESIGGDRGHRRGRWLEAGRGCVFGKDQKWGRDLAVQGPSQGAAVGPGARPARRGCREHGVSRGGG